MDIVQALKSFTLLGAQWVLWLLVALSIASITVMIERLRFFGARKVDLDQLIKDVKKALADGGEDAFRKRWASSRSMAARVALTGLAEADRGAEVAGADSRAAVKTKSPPRSAGNGLL